jgi:uncharacterized membrane protein YccC
LTVSILVRLEELIQALQDSRDLAGAIDGAAPARLRDLLRGKARRRLHLDHGMAALSGASLMAAVLLCCAAWILTAWPEGAIAAMMAAVFSSFFAAQDDPAPAIGSFLIWVTLAIPAAALYLFLILPAIDGFPMLALALAPALLLLGYFQASPRWSGAATAMIIGFAGGLALQATFNADLPEFLNVSLAQSLGIAAALVTARLMRSVGAGWAARRILRQGWREVVALARRRAMDADTWTSMMLDRVGLVATRAALAAPEDRLDAYDALADMRVGLNLIGLQALSPRGDSGQAIDRTLQGVARVFERRITGEADPADSELLQSIDHAIQSLADEDDPRPLGFAALVGLRRNLFPQAAPYAAGPA